MFDIKKKIVVFAAATVFVIGTVGCSLGAGSGSDTAQKEAGGQETIEFWTISLQPTFNDYFEKLIADFEKANPNVTISWKDYPKDTIQDKLLTSIASDNAPDVVNLNADMALTLGNKSALANAETYSSDETRNLYFDGIYNAAKVGDTVLALPWYTTIPVIYINESLLKAAGLPTEGYPTTTEEYYNWATEVTKKTNLYGMAMEANVREILGSAGVPIFNEDHTELLINKPEAVKVIKEFQTLYEANANPKENLDQETRAQLYNSKQVVSVYSGTTFVNKFKTTAPDVYENTTVIPVPFEHSVTTTMYLGVPDRSKHKELAFKFAEFVSNPENQLEFSKTANTLPSTKKTIEDAYFKEDDGSLEAKIKIAAASGLEKAMEIPVPQDILDKVNRDLQDILFNDKDVQQGLDKMVEEVNKQLID